MVSRETLLVKGLRAYELGRLRSAVRAALYLVPVAIVCAYETGARETCTCLGVLLLGISVFLRWRNRRGVESVTTGLLAGSIPLLAGLLVARFAPSCEDAPLLSWCTALSIAIGIPAGAWMGIRTARDQAGLSGWITAAGIASLSASLGCVALGVAGIAGAMLGLVAGGLLARGTS